MLIIPIMEYPQPGRMVPNQKGGQNLVDQNNFVYRKARFSPDKSKQFFKCVKCDLLKCKASVWIEVGTLIVNNTAMQEHNHSPPILELAARYSMFLIIHNMCTVFIRKYFRLLLCNQFGNETLFCLKQLYFVNLVVFIHPMCVMCTSLKKLLDIFYYYNFLQGDGEEDDQGSGTRRRWIRHKHCPENPCSC
jgi:hypothetical protein